jgi:pimeloyl-ACP methyl ester carboxylesterase
METALISQRIEERDVVVGGVRLHLREVGETGAAPVLFLHGIMGHRRDWDVLIDRVGERCCVIAVDQRGHGRSEWTHSYRVVDMADDAIALIEHLGVAPVPIVGHSMGAMVALVVAARRPELVDRIVLIDIVPDSLTTEVAFQMPEMFEALAAASYTTVEEAVAEWQAGNPRARTDLLRNYVTHALVSGPDGRLRWRFDALGLRGFVAGVTPDDLWSAADAVTCPSLVVRGEHSRLTTPDQAATLARRLGGGPVVVIPDGGHDLGVEQPESVADAVLEFLTPMPPTEEGLTA